jgi:DNA-binding response OmpR family regulator
MRVLVVEDDRSVRETLGIVLDSYGVQAELAESGQTALDYLAKSWPDVMLLDLTLEEMSGEELYEKIHARFQQVPPTVVLSAAQQGENRTRKMHGARFLAKPYTLEQLIQVLREAAARRVA